ncbi:MAG TPA: peptidylprolyl isomerase [Clostridia bacterium]|nr:peptidylprolyl isomerase [Clostridia bacterium]
MKEKNKEFPPVAPQKDKGAQAGHEHKTGKEEVIIKYGFIALGIILVICVVAFLVISIIPTNALSIGEYKISEEEFEYHYFEQKTMLYSQILEYYPDVSEAVFLNSEYQSGITYHEFAKQLALERISDIYILLDMAEQEGYVYDEVELADSKENFKKTFTDYAVSLDRKVDDVSKELYGSKFDIVLGIYENTWISSKYQDDLLLKYEGEVTEDEMQQYYDTYKDDLDQVTLKQLFISTYDTEAQEYLVDDEYDDAKARVDAAYERVLAGEDFDALIEELSEDPAKEETKGEYTSKQSEVGLPEIAEWAFLEAETGDITLLETQIGFHIVELISRTGFEEARDDVIENLAYGRMLQLLDQKKTLPEYEIGYYDAFNRF